MNSSQEQKIPSLDDFPTLLRSRSFKESTIQALQQPILYKQFQKLYIFNSAGKTIYNTYFYL